MKICPLGAQMFYADGQTYIMKLIDAFCNFLKAPKKRDEDKERAQIRSQHTTPPKNNSFVFM